MTPSDPELTLDTAGIQARLRAFRDERDWQQFHDPRSLTLALIAEVGELADSLSWRRDDALPPVRDVMADELADITTYVLHLANTLGIDLGAEVERKLAETRRRFADLPPGTPSRKPEAAE
jgi:dCTP diphosphatase